ncbi:MAG: hypothetical protein ABI761_17765 [Saprospiraceae bacterium]
MAKSKEAIQNQRSILDIRDLKAYFEPPFRGLLAADPIVEYAGKDQIEI